MGKVPRRVALKWLQAVLSALTIVLGLGTFLPLGYVTRYFGSNCVLYSDVWLLLSRNRTVVVDVSRTQWGSPSLCHFATFLPVVAAVHAFIWVWFFFHMYRLLREDGNEVYLALPAVVLHGALFICALTSSILISQGMTTFCSNLARNIKYKYTCEELQLLEWHLHGQTIHFTVYLQVSQSFSWLMTVAIGAQCLVTVAKSCSELFPSAERQQLDGGEEEEEEEEGEDLEYNEHDIDQETGSMLFLTPARLQSSSSRLASPSPTGGSSLGLVQEDSPPHSPSPSCGQGSTQPLVVA